MATKETMRFTQRYSIREDIYMEAAETTSYISRASKVSWLAAMEMTTCSVGPPVNWKEAKGMIF